MPVGNFHGGLKQSSGSQVVLASGPSLASGIRITAVLTVTIIPVVVIGIEKHGLDIIKDHADQLGPIQKLECSFQAAVCRLTAADYQHHAIAQARDDASIGNRRKEWGV